MPQSRSTQYAALVAEGADEFNLPTTYPCATPRTPSFESSHSPRKSRSVKPGSTSLDDLEEKEGLLSTLIPAPGGRRNRRGKCRVVALAVVVVLAAVLLYLALVGTGRKTGKAAGLGWTGSRIGEVSWGQANVETESGGSWDTTATATAVAQEDFYEDYSSTTISVAATPTTTGTKVSSSSLSSNQNTTSITAGKFSAAQMDAIDQMAKNGTLSAYKWHDTLPSLTTSSKSYSSIQKKDDGRLIIVGDLHGTHLSLLALLRRLSFAPSRDTLVHTGDVVGKSPLDASLQTLALLRKLGARGVRGNHDQRVVEWRRWMEALGPLNQSAAATSQEEGEQAEETSSSMALETASDDVDAPALDEAGAVSGGGFRKAVGGGARLGQAGARVPFRLRPGSSGGRPQPQSRERGRVKRGWFSWATGGSGAADSAQEEVGEATAGEEEWEASPYQGEEEYEASSSSEEAEATSSSTATAITMGGGLRRPLGRPLDFGPSSSSSPSPSATARPLPSSPSSSLAASTSLLAPLYAHLSPSLSVSQLAELGIRVPEGWEWGGDEFEIARHMSSEDRDYLEQLPLSLWVDEVAGWVVHAGLGVELTAPCSAVPWPSTPSSSLSTRSPVPSLLSSTSPLTFTPSALLRASLASSLRGSLLLTPQNTDPFTLLNMRSVSPSDTASDTWSVSSKGPKKAGQRGSRAWWSAWEEGMDALASGKGVGADGLFAVYGHWAGQGLKVQKHSIGLDTGCVYGRRLSALVVPRSNDDGDVSSPLSSTSSAASDPETAGAFGLVAGPNNSTRSSETSVLAEVSRVSSGKKKTSGKARPAKGKGKGKNGAGRTSVSLSSTTASSAEPTGTGASRVGWNGAGGGGVEDDEEVQESSLSSAPGDAYADADAEAEEEEELLVAPSPSSTSTSALTPGETESSSSSSDSKPWWRPWTRRTPSSSSDNINNKQRRRFVQLAETRAPPQYRPDGGASLEDEAEAEAEDEAEAEAEAGEEELEVGEGQTLGRSRWWGSSSSSSSNEDEDEDEVEVDSAAAVDVAPEHEYEHEDEDVDVDEAGWAGAQVNDDLDGVEAALLRTSEDPEDAEDDPEDASDDPEQEQQGQGQGKGSDKGGEEEGDVDDDSLLFAEQAVVVGGRKRAWVVSVDCAREVDDE
ncbi:hypothetical protein JCM5296_001895 [Sporobolomyces johnsonii]